LKKKVDGFISGQDDWKRYGAAMCGQNTELRDEITALTGKNTQLTDGSTALTRQIRMARIGKARATAEAKEAKEQIELIWKEIQKGEDVGQSKRKASDDLDRGNKKART
jgi:hypothetical protein